jgi:putative Ca2+/H+ antiporter (TMEM165/GDT1 family)
MIDLILHPHITGALFLSTFALIFIAELPDKTALAALILATRHQPSAVFLGCAGAFLIQNIVSVVFGSFFGLLPHQIVHIASGCLFILFAVLMWLRKDEEKEELKDSAKTFWQTVSKSFMVIFIAEWGDLTQLASATLVAKTGEPWTIFLSATLALWTTSALAVLIGNQAKKLINEQLLQRIAAVLFAGVGILLLAGFWD